MENLILSRLREALKNSVSRRFGKKPPLRFETSEQYWKDRYDRSEYNSGAGSYGRLAEFKAEVLNEFVANTRAKDVIELGSGDGNQLSLAVYPKYTGFDVSPQALDRCKKRFRDDATKEFFLMSELGNRTADIALSLDVIYHLVEDSVFENYMASLFRAAKRFVVIYASNTEEQGQWAKTNHVRHRRFTDWIEENRSGWVLAKELKNKYPFDPNMPSETSFADFYFFQFEGK